jgi:hypothetical protein
MKSASATLIILLLAQRVQPRQLLGPRHIGVDDDVVAVAVGRIKTVDSFGTEEFFVDDLLQQLQRVGEQLARRRAAHRIIEQLRIATAHFPGMKKGRPVDKWHQLGQRKIVEHASADKLRNGDMMVVPFGVKLVTDRFLVTQ